MSGTHSATVPSDFITYKHAKHSRKHFSLLVIESRLTPCYYVQNRNADRSEKLHRVHFRALRLILSLSLETRVFIGIP